MHHPTDRITHTTPFVTPVVEHWLEREIAQWVIHTQCQLQYLHPPHISTSGKCHCVIIHQTTKATEYIG